MKMYKIGSACVKCGERGASSHYGNLSFYSLGKYITNELIGRTCKNCGFTWSERPLDHKENNHGSND